MLVIAKFRAKDSLLHMTHMLSCVFILSTKFIIDLKVQLLLHSFDVTQRHKNAHIFQNDSSMDHTVDVLNESICIWSNLCIIYYKALLYAFLLNWNLYYSHDDEPDIVTEILPDVLMNSNLPGAVINNLSQKHLILARAQKAEEEKK